jgi:hypothetical protein
MKKILIALIIFSFGLVGKAQQQSGTVDQIRILTDANNSLLVKAYAQVSPVSQPGLFANARLVTDASGNLQIVFVGGTITGATILSLPNLITTPTAGFSLTNPTLATAGVPVQISPSLYFNDNVWNTTATAANNTDQWFIYSAPVSGTTPSGLLKFGNSLNGGGTTYPATLTSGGTFTILGNISFVAATASAAITTAANGPSVAPIILRHGILLSAATVDAVENDAVSFYNTVDTINGRRAEDDWNYFRLIGSGSGITATADFFGTTGSGIPLVANGVYEIEWYCQFSQATAGTATWTIVTAATPLASITGEYVGSPIAGIGAVGTPQYAGINTVSSTSTAFPVTGSEANVATHIFNIHVVLTAGNGASNTRLRLTMSAGTATPLINSYFKVRRLPAGNTGAFVS